MGGCFDRAAVGMLACCIRGSLLNSQSVSNLKGLCKRFSCVGRFVYVL